MKNIPKNLKNMVWNEYIGENYHGDCYCCANKINVFNFHAGHIIPFSKGGETNLSNLRPICSHCNLSMSTQNMNDFAEKYGLNGKINNKFVKIGKIIYSEC